MPPPAIDVSLPVPPAATPPAPPARGLVWLEALLFRQRALVLAALLLLTVVMGVFALQLRMDAGFEKQLPIGHEYEIGRAHV